MFKFLFSLNLLFILAFNVSNAESINSITINGNKRVSDETIKVFGDLDSINSISNDKLNVILKNLYETNFFSDVDLSFEDGNLIINVKEYKLIQSIEITGAKNSIVKEIKKQIVTKEKSSFIKGLVEKDSFKIKNILKASGYYFVEVKSFVKINDNETVNLSFEIDRGPKASIDQIKFIGDKIFKSKALRSVVTSEESKFWKILSTKQFLDAARIDRDARLLKGFYLNKGFYDVNINQSFAQYLDNSKFHLIFNIDAGPRYKLNDLKLDLPNDYEEKNFLAINKIFKELKGSYYSLNNIEIILDEIDKIALSKQYEFIKADVEEKKIDNNKINITIFIDESKKYYVEKINIFGNDITQEEVIRNSLEVDEGDAFNEILHAKSINNLKAKNIFSKVQSEIIDGTSPSSKSINITLEEKPTGEISAGAGIGTTGGSIAFSLKENNYLGKGISLDSSISLGANSVRGLINTTLPNFRYSDKDLTASLESIKTTRMKDYGYDTSKNGLSLGTYYEQFDDLYFSPSSSIYFETLETDATASRNLKNQAGDYFDVDVSYGLNYDKRNQRFKPTDGYFSKFTQRLPLISKNYSLMNGYEYAVFHEISENMVTSIRFFGKTINSLNDENVRVSERLYLSSRRLRGFKQGKVGPKDEGDFIGGNYASSVNLATTLPKFLSVLDETDFKLFFDAGNIWGIDYDDKLSDNSQIRSSAGLAIDWYTPIGPLSFSLAQPITKASSDVTETFRFNIGTSF